MQQWRHAWFQNLPVRVNLDRLAAFVGNRHFFRAFLASFQVNHNLQSCSSPPDGTSCLESGPVYIEAPARSYAASETHWTCDSDCSNRSSEFRSCNRTSHDDTDLECGESCPGSTVSSHTTHAHQHKPQDAMRGSLESVRLKSVYFLLECLVEALQPLCIVPWHHANSSSNDMRLQVQT